MKSSLISGKYPLCHIEGLNLEIVYKWGNTIREKLQRVFFECYLRSSQA